MYVTILSKDMKDKKTSVKLKADRPHPPNYPHTQIDYIHTDKHFSGGVMGHTSFNGFGHRV